MRIQKCPSNAAITQSGNLYGFCMNNPIRYVDPSGHAAAAVAAGEVFVTAIQYIMGIGIIILSTITFNKNKDNTVTYIYDGPEPCPAPAAPSKTVSSAAQSNSGSISSSAQSLGGSTPANPDPNDPKKGNSGRYSQMNQQDLLKSKSSYEKLIEEHTQKLQDYIKNPDGFDNKGLLRNISESLREQIINGRINALSKQIAKQVGELSKILEALKLFK